MYSHGNATPETNEMFVSGRAAVADENHRWMDKEGNRLPIRYAFSPPFLKPDDKLKAVIDWQENRLKWWTTNTCLKFEKVSLPSENQKEIDDWCWQDVEKKDKVLLMTLNAGQDYGISPKKDDRCVKWDHSLTLGRGVNEAKLGEKLGMLYIIYRDDRDTYISLNYENMIEINKDLSSVRASLKCLDSGKSVPMPMDFLSMMSYYSYIYNNVDTVPTIVSRDPYQQYLFEYKNFQMPPPSALDLQTINLMYKCTDDWAAACRESGKEVPKCKNYGYLTKDCVCSCLPVYTGKLCETKISTNFPYPLQDGVFNCTITEGGVYDLGEMMPISAPVDPDKFDVIFIIVKLEPSGKGVLPFVSVRMHPDGVKALHESIKREEKDAMTRPSMWDCTWGIRMMWGSDNQDKGRRLACECTSVFGFNEPKENARVLSARSENMTLTYSNRLGEWFHSIEYVSRDTSRFILEAHYREPPKLTQKQNRTSDGGGGGGGVGGVNGTESPLTVTAAAMTAAGGAGGMAAIIGAVAALLLLCLLCLLLMKRRKKKKNLDELGEEEEGSEGSGSGSDEN